MIRRRPPLYSVLALWLSCTLSATAQEFYIELRGPETPAAQPSTPATPQAVAPVSARVSRYGPITTTDTLWSIAARHTQAPATVQQTMVALYYLNPGAFVRGNINYLQRGAVLRLPTLTQAQQRTPREAESEFRRLSRQGSRTGSRTPSTTSQPQATVAAAEADTQTQTTAPVLAKPPVAATAPKPAAPPATTVKAASSPEPAEAPKPASAHGLSEPRAAKPAATPVPAQPEPVQAQSPTSSAAGPDEAEQVALERLQARLLDELREQVAMSNEQLAQLADNNQALRQRLGQLTAEVNELKMVRTQQAMPEANAAVEKGGWFSEMLKQPLNLALLLTLPALLLLALFTLWWRKRLKEDMAEQEADSSQLMMEEEHNDFDDLFATELSAVNEDSPAANADDEVEIDEDAFARFLEEQERQEQEEAESATMAAEPVENPDDILFEDEMASAEANAEPAVDPDDILFEDEMASAEVNAEPVEDPDDILFEDEMASAEANAEPAVDPDDILFEDDMASAEANAEPAVDPDDILFENEMANAEANAKPVEDPEDIMSDIEMANAESSEKQSDNVEDNLFDNELAMAREELTVEPGFEDAIFDGAMDTFDATREIDDNLDQPFFGSQPAEAELALDDSLFDLGEPEEEPVPEPSTEPKPVSLAEQGAFDDELTSRFDNVLADATTEEQGAAAEAIGSNNEASSFFSSRDSLARHELDDYAELLGNGQEVDIDLDEGGMGAKLDLARAYIEIDDLESARELLTEALEKGNEQQQGDARKLLQRLDRR